MTTLEQDGFVALSARLPEVVINSLASLFPDSSPGDRLTDSVPDAIITVLAWPPLADALAALDARCRPVRILLFAKRPEANWFVPWHQDAAVAIDGDAVAHGFVNRTVKRGVVHWEAPPSLLERMLAVRIHIDAAAASDGPLEIVAGSHRQGFVDAASTHDASAKVCTAERGEVHLLRPLLLHRSRKAETPSGRRTVQIELAPRDALPDGLAWRLAA